MAEIPEKTSGWSRRFRELTFAQSFLVIGAIFVVAYLFVNWPIDQYHVTDHGIYKIDRYSGIVHIMRHDGWEEMGNPKPGEATVTAP